MISSILTPVRWYNDIYESDRFSSDCDIERFELISDKTRLLPFQFHRPKSGELLSSWFLRKQCEDPSEGLLNTNDSLFIFDTGYWSTYYFIFLNGKIKATGGPSPATLSKPAVFTIGAYYTIKIVVSDFKNTSTFFNVSASYTTTDSFAITGPGVYTATFLADQTNFSVNGLSGILSDYITIESIQFYEYKGFDVGLGDINLPLDLLTLVNLNDDEDLIQYCGAALPIQIPCGKYYMIITQGEKTAYYSELITVKDFIPSQSPYTMIEWKNSCDISDIIYQTVNGCGYANRLYIEGELTKPEYPFKEESDEDGEYKLNVLFQKWEKKTSLIVAKCPEFMVDALTGIRLHDTIHLTKSLRKKQIQVLAPFEVDKVEFENSSIFSDCATNVELKILLKDKAVDSTCCNNNIIPTCIACQYIFSDFDVLENGYYFGTPEGMDYGLYSVIDDVYTPISAAGQVVCVGDDKYLNLNSEYWTKVPLIYEVSDTDLGSGNHSYNLTGYVYLGTYLTIQVLITDYDTDLTITIDIEGVFTQQQLNTGILILNQDLFTVPANGIVSFIIHSFSLNCDYGYSQEFGIEYLDIHPMLRTWYNELTIKIDYSKLRIFNNFIQGLDDDGILEEFDLIHVLAGLDYDEQRLKPFFTTSGFDFTTTGTFVWNSNGFTGDGSTGFIDSKWKPLSNGVKHLQDDASFGVYINTSLTNSAYSDIGCFDSIYSIIYSRNGSGNFRAAINNGVRFMGAVPSSIGMFYVQADGSDQNSYRNSTLIATSSNPTPTPSDNNLYIGAANNLGTAVNHSPRQIQFVFIGSKLVDPAILAARFATLKSALGF